MGRTVRILNESGSFGRVQRMGEAGEPAVITLTGPPELEEVQPASFKNKPVLTPQSRVKGDAGCRGEIFSFLPEYEEVFRCMTSLCHACARSH